jgi:outer membrane autotransporter protein
VHATAPNSVSALIGLSHYTGISPQLLQLFDAADALNGTGNVAAGNRAGAQLAPTTQASSSTAAAASTFDALTVISSHADGLRLALADGETGIATGEAGSGWAGWGQAFGGGVSQGSSGQIDGTSASYGGLLLGVDRAVDDRWRLGAAFTYSRTDLDDTGNGTGHSTRIDGFGGILYASFAGDPWYANLSGGVVGQDFRTRRAIDFPGFSGQADGHFGGDQYVARIEAGYPLKLADLALTPLASLAYAYQHQDAYTETGGNGAALSLGSSQDSSVRSGLGFKLSKSF